MAAQFRFKLTLAMLVFALTVSITIATMNHLQLKNEAIHNEMSLIEQDIAMLKYALETSEKANLLLGENISTNMRDVSLSLLDMYDSKPGFEEWDFQQLSSMMSLDIYIIDSENKITHSNVPSDIGLDFSTCCAKLAKVLDERRASGEFFHDGLDVEQHTGLIKKYSYMATRDKKFIIQLGYSLQEGDIFQQFNFLNTIESLVQSNSAIDEINVLNIGGLSLGDTSDLHKLTKERREAFERTLETGETIELRSTWNGGPAIYRYVLYSSSLDTGSTQYKVLEMVYNERHLEAILHKYRQNFIIQLGMVLFVSVILAFLISRWVARPMHLAFHDSLTGLKNRAALDESLKNVLAASHGTIALLLIDLDNFKQVNDTLGHDRGDALLKQVAHILRRVARKDDIAIRLGGDEFVLVMPAASKEDASRIAELIIAAVQEYTGKENTSIKGTSVSIGAAFAPEHGTDQDTLFKKADLALYMSKELGKNQYQIYSDSTLSS